MGVGMLDSIPKINVGEIIVPHGSKIICFTDGSVEIENIAHQAFGTEPIENLVKQGDNIADDIDNLVELLYEHKGPDGDFFDDITIMGIEFK